MGNKIFISYKYADSSVQTLNSIPRWEQTTPRHYVDIIQDKVLPKYGHIYKGEKDDESLEEFKDDTIRTKLSDKIFDSTITLVLISPNMKEEGYWAPNEKDQWIPWEISYSLRKKNRRDKVSYPNAVLAIVLPDENGSYDYANNRYFGFEIINENRNNLLYDYPQTTLKGTCSQSYILRCNWDQFLSQFDGWIKAAIEIRQNIDKYQLKVRL